MNTFIAQLNQLLMSANEDDWLAGLCDLLRTHAKAWVRITGRGGRLVAEALPLDGTYPGSDALPFSGAHSSGDVLPGTCTDNDALLSTSAGDYSLRPDNTLPIGEIQSIDIPIRVGETNLGHLKLSRQSNPFDETDIQMADIAAGICTILLRQRERQAIGQRRQRLELVRGAINALSFSELEAAIHITQAINGPEGRLVAGHIADRLGFTRSVVVNALKKLEGAGVIETRSLGVKGTYIRVKELILTEELSKLGTVK